VLPRANYLKAGGQLAAGNCCITGRVLYLVPMFSRSICLSRNPQANRGGGSPVINPFGNAMAVERLRWTVSDG